MYKWIGLLAGFFVFGFFGGLLGLFVGSIIDRVQSLGLSGANPLTAAQRQAIFLETLFVIKGKIAKSDGRITQDEVDHVEAFIKKIGLSAEHRQQAIAQFKRGAEPDFDISATVENFKRYCGHTFNMKQMLLLYLTVMALADGTLDQAERSILEQVAVQLGYSRAEFNRILEMVLSQSHFAGGQTSSTNPASALADAYKALGVAADATDQQVKRAYRKLMSQHHPDKLMGQGLSEDMLKVATEQAQEIQLAYDLIKKSRGLN